jgi:hypothetical protein
MEDGPHGVFRTIAKYATMSAYDLFTEQQQTIFYRMMDWGNAEHIGKELGLSRSRVVEIYCNCLRKIPDGNRLGTDTGKGGLSGKRGIAV